MGDMGDFAGNDMGKLSEMMKQFGGGVEGLGGIEEMMKQMGGGFGGKGEEGLDGLNLEQMMAGMSMGGADGEEEIKGEKNAEALDHILPLEDEPEEAPHTDL